MSFKRVISLSVLLHQDPFSFNTCVEFQAVVFCVAWPCIACWGKHFRHIGAWEGQIRKFSLIKNILGSIRLL